MKDTTKATATGTMLIDRLAIKYSCKKILLRYNKISEEKITLFLKNFKKESIILDNCVPP